MAPMPTQNGQAPGKVSMSGGWTWSIPPKAKNPDLAWKFIKTLQTKDERGRSGTSSTPSIAVRKDVAADPTYLKSHARHRASSPTWSQYTHYRPALPVYPQVSTAIQEAMEAVTTGDSSPDEAPRTPTTSS